MWAAGFLPPFFCRPTFLPPFCGKWIGFFCWRKARPSFFFQTVAVNAPPPPPLFKCLFLFPPLPFPSRVLGRSDMGMIFLSFLIGAVFFPPFYVADFLLVSAISFVLFPFPADFFFGFLASPGRDTPLFDYFSIFFVAVGLFPFRLLDFIFGFPAFVAHTA